MTTLRTQLGSTILAAAVLCIGSAAAETLDATAAAPPGTEPAIDEIVVTAEKTKEVLQKAPAAITAITGDAFIRRGNVDIRGVENSVPSAIFAEEQTNTQIFVRGIGSSVDSAAVDPSIAFNFNGIYLPREATGNTLFDIERIEILPGPQGTLYGRSSAGGAVNVEAKRPSDKFESSGLLEVGNYSTVHFSAAENLPITDGLAVRAALNYLNHDGYQKTGADSADTVSGRLSVLAKPIDNLSILIWGQYNTDQSNTTNVINVPLINPGDYWDDTRPARLAPNGPIKPGDRDVRTTVVAGEITYDLPGFSVSLLPSYLFYNQLFTTYVGPNLEKAWVSIHQFTDELKFASTGDGPLRWVGGLYYYQFIDYQDLFFGPTYAFKVAPDAEEGWAGYGQATYALLDWLRLTGGLRYSASKKTADGFNPDPRNRSIADVPYFFDHIWHNIDWKVGIDADVFANSLAYANVQTGFNQGSYNGFLSTPTRPNTIEPTKLLAFTAGLKNRFLDNRLELNDEAFYYNYKDLIVQAFSANTGNNQLFNANKVVIWGDQVDLRWHVDADDTLNLGIGYLHARNRDFRIGAANYGNYAVTNSPDLTVNLGGEHVWNLADGATIALRVDSHYANGYWATFQHVGGSHQSAYTKTDVAITYYAADDRWNVALWARNIEDSAVLAASAPGGLPGPVSSVIEPRRTFGARFAYDF